jgi:hypothetical protein
MASPARLPSTLGWPTEGEGHLESLRILINPSALNLSVIARVLSRKRRRIPRKRRRIPRKRRRIPPTPGNAGETPPLKGSQPRFRSPCVSNQTGNAGNDPGNAANNPDRFQRRRSGAFSSQGHPPQVPGIAGLSRMSGDISGVLLELSNSRLRVGPKLLNK